MYSVKLYIDLKKSMVQFYLSFALVIANYIYILIMILLVFSNDIKPTIIISTITNPQRFRIIIYTAMPYDGVNFELLALIN